MRPLRFTLNGAEKAVFVAEGENLLDVLRRKAGDFAPKLGCAQGTCGACSVLVDGRLRLSCVTLAETVEGARIETASGLDAAGGHPLQEAFMAGFAAQCGFCTPGMLMAAKALLDANPRPSREDVVEAIGGNVCRCTGYEPIIDAVLAASQRRSA